MSDFRAFCRSVLCTIVVALAVSAVTAPMSVAQQPPPQPDIRLEVDGKFQPRETSGDRRLVTARRLIRIEDWQSASALLEELVAVDSSDAVAATLLLRCYDHLKQYLKAEKLTRHLAEHAPTNLAYRLSLAEVLATQGKTEEADRVYGEAIDLIDRFELQRFVLVLSSQIEHGRPGKAMALIDSLRLTEGDSTLFGLQKGSLLERQRQYARAAIEYYPILVEDTTRDAVTAEKRLSDLLQFPDSEEEVERTLQSVVQEKANARVFSLLASFYIRSGRFDDAFEFSIRHDSASGRQGQAPMYFIQECRERKEYAQVVRMGEYILATYERGAFVNEASFRYAEALAEVGRIGDALAAYRRIGASSPGEKDVAEALYRTGWIYLERLHQYDSALAYFDSVVTYHPRGVGLLRSLRGIPSCHLRLGHLDRAKSAFEALTHHRLNEDMQEEVEYYLALLEGFGRNYDTAEVRLRKLMVDHPRGLYVNDALRLVMLFSETQGSRDALDKYIDALLYRERLLADSARLVLSELAASDGQALADMALYELAELAAEAGDTTEALARAEQLITGFPESYYLPFGLKLKADILVGDVDRIDEAGQLYRRLLQDHPNYPFITEVRKQLRQLETDVRIG